MSKIAELTGFMRDELPKLHELAGETRDLAQTMKAGYVRVVSQLNGEMRTSIAELKELEDALALTSNNPPKEGDNQAGRFNGTAEAPKPEPAAIES